MVGSVVEVNKRGRGRRREGVGGRVRGERKGGTPTIRMLPVVSSIRKKRTREELDAVTEPEEGFGGERRSLCSEEGPSPGKNSANPEKGAP